MAWLLLILAGVFEILWVIGMKYSDGFTKWVPSSLSIGAMILSVGFLSLAVRTLPIGMSYAIWTGIGTLGVVLFGIFWLGESASVMRLLFIAFILVGIIGLKLSR